MNKYIIITSIFSPTEAIKKFSKKNDWKVIVVGDKKTPQEWFLKNVIFFSEKNQKNLKFKICRLLPWNHYSRKMIGYLHAIQNGAEIIADTDDDNFPLETWGNLDFKNENKTISGIPYFNIYKLYTNIKNIWPRGYPLSQVLNSQKPIIKKQKNNIGIWQFLVDEEPDVDAIYRLTINKHIYFNKKIKPLILGKGCLCPFNSQNTFFKKETFSLLYLPAYVNFRVTDILRSYVAQVILWNTNLKVGFGTSTAIQKRNPHNYIKDFESEIPLYTESEKIINILKKAVKKNNSISENLMNCYESLYLENIVQKQEIELLKAWLNDLEKLI